MSLDLVDLAASMMVAWLTGYAMGYLVYTLKRFAEKI